MLHTDICIAGAGIIGLSLALELQTRGASVTVIERDTPMQQASFAAAGMLAADDPHNAPELSALSHFSLSLYDDFLTRIYSLSQQEVPIQTRRTLQAIASNPAPTLPPQLQAELHFAESTHTLAPSSGFHFLSESSIDPRQLAAALIAAIDATSIRTLYNSPVKTVARTATQLQVTTSSTTLEATHFIDCTGAWANAHDQHGSFRSIPIKGQMLSLAMPPDVQLKTTLRTEDIYILPRTLGPHAGRAIVGATVEDVGFDKTVHAVDLERLRNRAISLVPALHSAPIVESWAGLRPATCDRLPLIGPHPTRPNHWFATGHFRNGILLAPGTARIVSELILGRTPSVDISSFSPSRVALAEPANT